MKKSSVCPRCNGTRVEVREIEPKTSTPVDGWSQYKYTECHIQCERCNGTGVINNDASDS